MWVAFKTICFFPWGMVTVVWFSLWCLGGPQTLPVPNETIEANYPCWNSTHDGLPFESRKAAKEAYLCFTNWTCVIDIRKIRYFWSCVTLSDTREAWPPFCIRDWPFCEGRTSTTYTLKIKMEPKDYSIEKEHHLPTPSFWGSISSILMLQGECFLVSRFCIGPPHHQHLLYLFFP